MQIKTFLLAAAMATASGLSAQDSLRLSANSNYEFTIDHNLEATSVKNQFRSGTCWSFSTLSFFESELNRMGKGEYDLSEMFVVYHTYSDKATKYARMHGSLNFGAGGAFHDVLYVMDHYGMVPESAYDGLNYGTDKHTHGELDEVTRAYMDAVLKNKNKQLSSAWHNGFEGILDAYLGEIPSEFEYNGKTYTPETYMDALGLNPDDYVSLTSFTHHPYYEQFAIEVPDNWLNGMYYNVTLDELIDVMDNAIENDMGIAWAADVSEKGFNFRSGLAIVPEDNAAIEQKGKDSRSFNNAGAERRGNQFVNPGSEKIIDAEMRQKAFDNYETTDDHGMHITGMAHDQNGTKYYIVKNSWGTGFNETFDGYFMASEAYVRYKTMNILVHKDALPKELKKKLGIK